MNSYNDKEEKIIEMIKNLIDSGVSDRLIVSRFEFKILNLKNPKLYFWFAKNVKGIDIESNEQTVIDKIDPEWSYKFARDIAGADVKAHEKVVFKYGNQIESELELLDNYLDDAMASEEKDTSKSMTK